MSNDEWKITIISSFGAPQTHSLCMYVGQIIINVYGYTYVWITNFRSANDD